MSRFNAPFLLRTCSRAFFTSLHRPPITSSPSSTLNSCEPYSRQPSHIHLHSLKVFIHINILPPRAVLRPLQHSASPSLKMSDRQDDQHTRLPKCPTSHPDNPVHQEPIALPSKAIDSALAETPSSSSSQSLGYTSSSDSESPGTPETDPQLDDVTESIHVDKDIPSRPSTPKRRRASTVLISQSPEDVSRILSSTKGAETKEIEKVCCGGGCCFMNTLQEDLAGEIRLPGTYTSGFFCPTKLELES